MHSLQHKIFGRLTVLFFAGTMSGRRYWMCQCLCGRRHKASTNKLTSGNTKSCGCLAQELRGQPRITHGETRGPRLGWGPRTKMWYAAKSRAKKSGVPFTIKITDIVIPATCPVFGFPLIRNRGGFAQFDSPSLDRVIANKGYVAGNIQVISHKANTMKSDATVEELETLLRFLKSK